MLGMTCAIIIGIVLPLGLFVYALVKKRAILFVLGIFAFVVSQMLLRLPLLNYLHSKSISFNMFSVTQPIIYILIIGFSAGIFEEVARYVAIRFFMKQHDFLSGTLFGAGHGGIEAVIFLGIQAIMMVSSPIAIVHSDAFLLGSVERFFAMMFHIGLSIIILYSVAAKQIRYLIVAIILHGIMDSFVGFVLMIVSKPYDIFVIEGILIVMSMSVIIYSIQLKRRGVL